ncbi:MAG: cysteine methyltransferase [Candidatus Pacebacteria bacterium CG10_big_fil_rev_8_21_14_0_10_44_11]|nr:MAG: cysteine methyltransferase [Candidatus Pacebacteria bacterium CG10_big_fil_rev_8_21_14_0_10_44_11]
MKDALARPIVLDLVGQIPKGKVSTYLEVAQAAGAHPRQVGRILHTNTNPERYPCHRVVHADGRTAAGYVFGGPGKQQARLKVEGVTFLGEKVKLRQYLFCFPLEKVKR